jgi:hypothetical protein
LGTGNLSTDWRGKPGSLKSTVVAAEQVDRVDVAFPFVQRLSRDESARLRAEPCWHQRLGHATHPRR